MAFEDIAPMETVDEGVEDQDLAAPETEEAKDEGAEDQDFAAPDSEEPEESGKSAADARFAEMRRQLEESERAKEQALSELEDLRQKQAARQAALANMDVDEIDAIAEQLGITRDEVLEQIEREEAAAEAEIEMKEKDQLIADLQAQIEEMEIEKTVSDEIAELQRIDPKINLEELAQNEEFKGYIANGLTAVRAYFAVKGEEIVTKATPAKPPGRVADVAPPDKDYYTEEEVANMTSQERYDNAEKIMASIPKWKKK